MAKERILIIEDDPDIVELVEYNLSREGYQVFSAGDGERGLQEAAIRHPELILLDLMLPGMEGLELCRRLKRQEATRRVPVIMITAKGEEADVVTGLEVGADDYVPKPFSVRELLARVRAVLRRYSAPAEEDASGHIESGGVVIDSGRFEVLVQGRPVDLTRAEFRLLHALASRPGRVFTRSQLVEKITGGESRITERNVDVHVRAVRKKLGSEAALLATIRGVGYKWRD